MVRIDKLEKFSKINESRLVVATQYKSIFNYYLDKLGLTVDDLSDIFSELLDFDFEHAYLQLAFLGSDGIEWSALKEEGEYTPYFFISLSSEDKKNITIGNDTSLLSAFIETVNNLSSNLDSEFNLSWFLKSDRIKISIFLGEKINLDSYNKILYL